MLVCFPLDSIDKITRKLSLGTHTWFEFLPTGLGSAGKSKGRLEGLKYQNLVREVRKMWGVTTRVTTAVVGTLETVPLRLKDDLRVVVVDTSISLIQKSALLGSARILRKIQEM